MITIGGAYKSFLNLNLFEYWKPDSESNDGFIIGDNSDLPEAFNKVSDYNYWSDYNHLAFGIEMVTASYMCIVKNSGNFSFNYLGVV